MKKLHGILICGALGVSLLSGVLISSSEKNASVKEEKPFELHLIKGAPVQPKGSGTSGDPYKIGSVEELEWLRNYINSQSKAANRNKYAILTSDIDLQGSSENQWVPIGYSDDRDFRGTFDGDGYTIHGLYINDTSRSMNGLFGRVRSGTVKNLTVRGEVTGTSQCGGIIGYLYQGTATRCYNYATVRVTGESSAGGIAGRGYQPTISNCINYGSVTASSSKNGSAGGITAGSNDGNVNKCANYGAVTGSLRVGGIVGSTNTSDTLVDCYNIGNISNSNYIAGGIDGEATDGTIRRNHNVGTVSGKNKGGVIGSFNSFSSNVGDNYYKDGSCNSDAAGSTKVAVANYTTQSSFSGFNFTNTWRMGPNYPVLRHTFSGGDGSESNPYIVKSVADLDHIRDDVAKHYKLGHDINYFGSETNLFTPIGTTAAPFTGSFDGDGCTVSNIYIKNTTSPGEPVGFFGSAASGSIIKNFTLGGTVINEDTTNNPNTNNTGGIVGFSEGKVFQCHNNVIVSGKYNVGGVVGRLGYQYTSYSAETFPTIEQCSNHAAITAAEETAGGIVGRAYGLITNSFNDGKVSISSAATSGHNIAGGIVGSLHGASGSETSRIEKCHNQALISAYAYVGSLIGYKQSGNIYNSYYYGNCYVGNKGYNMNGAVGTSSVPQTATGSSPLNDEQRNVPSNYSGWDFNTIWMKGDSYPVFYDAVKLVIMAINEIGTVDASTECLAKINNAKTLYNALSAEEKAKVTNYATLVEAEVQYVEALIDLIELGVFTDANKIKIDTAKAAYNSLSSTQKSSVDANKVTLLGNAEKVYNAEKAIDDIPEPFVYTNEFKGFVDAARSAYNALGGDASLEALVDNYQKLLDAEAFWKEQDDLAKAQECKDLIDAIAPIEYSIDCRDRIEDAREFYDDLSAEAKTIVGDEYLAKLVSYEKQYDCMDKINKIGTVKNDEATLNKINDARHAYDDLSASEQANISNYNVLVSDEKIYEAIVKIDEIGTVTYTEECKERIDAAVASYGHVDEADQSKVSNYQKLVDALAAYKDLDDQAKADACKTLINEIGEVILSNPTKEAIEAAEAAYEALNEEAKALVGEELHQVLVEAREAYNALVDQAAAKEVVAKIDAIGEVNKSDECKAKIDDARAAYDALSEGQKSLVDNYDKLVEAEKAYAELSNGLPGWAIALIVIGCLLAVCAIAYCLLFFVFHKWIKQNRKAIKVAKLWKRHGKFLVMEMNFKFHERLPEEIYKSKEDALNA